ncbi:YnbE family lipoprotein [Aurantivibrio infirmus]
MNKVYLFLFCTVVALTSACTPTVRVASDPIEINMNIKIEHEVRVKVDKELETLFEDESLF